VIKDKKKMITYLVSGGLGLAAAVSGALLVAPSEGYNPNTYLDPVGIITSCYGHTSSDLKEGQKFTDEQCLDQFASDLSEADQGVTHVIHVPLTLWQRAALISFTYNVGEGNLASSTIAKEFNQKEYDAGCDHLLDWVYAKKKKLKGLEERRKLERSMCLGQMELPDVNTN
jgi:lysozyme